MIFYSYVSLPEGNQNLRWSWKPGSLAMGIAIITILDLLFQLVGGLLWVAMKRPGHNEWMWWNSTYFMNNRRHKISGYHVNLSSKTGGRYRMRLISIPTRKMVVVRFDQEQNWGEWTSPGFAMICYGFYGWKFCFEERYDGDMTGMVKLRYE